jgi:type I restriction enzyme M protein
VKEEHAFLQNQSKQEIENLTDQDMFMLLSIKWITPIVSNINNLKNELINGFIKNIEKLSMKYDVTLLNLESEIQTTEKVLSSLIDELTGNEFDMKGLNEFQALLNGDKHE